MVHSHLYYHKREIILLVSRDVVTFGMVPSSEVTAYSFPPHGLSLSITCAPPTAPHVFWYQLYVLNVSPDIYLPYCVG
jgi:hypothetical protein